MSDENKTRDTIDAMTSLAKAVSIYPDMIQPAAKELGKGLQTVAQAINATLTPLRLLVWGSEQIEEFVTTRVAEKLQHVPLERIRPPEPHVVCPTLEALRYTGHESELRELYASLLATSLDSDTCRNAHPAFVDIIKNMSPDEAKIMKLFSKHRDLPAVDLQINIKKERTTTHTTLISNHSFIGALAGCSHPDLMESYLKNLSRLGLIEQPPKNVLGAPYLSQEGVYEPLEATLANLCDDIRSGGQTPKITRSFFRITPLGTQFCRACVDEREPPTKS